MAYWLMKSEPDAFSIDDLEKVDVEPWDGVRNYQARNFMRQMQVGDHIFFYHSNTKVPGIVGVMTVAKAAYPDPTQFNPESKYYDPKSDPDKPRWDLVEVKFGKKWQQVLSLQTLKNMPELANFKLVQKGNRLSVMPVSEQHWQTIMQVASEFA